MSIFKTDISNSGSSGPHASSGPLSPNGTTLLNGNQFAWSMYGSRGETPLLLLHGTSLNRASFADVIDELSRSSHIVLPDIRGHAESWDGTPTEYQTVTFSDDIYEMANHFWPGQPIVVVGASISALHSIHFAAAHPELVKGLVLVDMLPTFSTKKVNAALGFTNKQFSSVEEAAAQVLALMTLSAVPNMPTPERLTTLLNRFLTRQGDGSPLGYHYDRSFIDHVIHESHEPLWDSLAKVTCPILLLEADHGSIIDEKGISRFRSVCPGAAHSLIPGSRHNIMHDAPAAFVEAIKGFVSSLPHKVPANPSSSDAASSIWSDDLCRPGSRQTPSAQ